MTPATCQLKRPSGWFAAGREVHQALMLLSDSAFRLAHLLDDGEAYVLIADISIKDLEARQVRRFKLTLSLSRFRFSLLLST